jgi:hypothetical protein
VEASGRVNRALCHVYRLLVQAHPAEFREQFGEEMAWIFEETRQPALFYDALLSLARQWVLRSGAWTMAAGGGVALVVFAAIFGFGVAPVLAHGPAKSAPPQAQFGGTWAGHFAWPAPVGQMELTLGKLGDAWNGELAVRGMDGVVHRGPAEEIVFAGDSITFHVRTAYGPMKFNGRLIEGQLAGALQPAAGTF